MIRTFRWSVLALLVLLGGCASKDIVLELQGSILYEKPRIERVSYSVSDARREGGTVVVTVRLIGDPGLDASFDISPEIADHAPMAETDAGSYQGEFSFPPDRTGGPFTIVGRLRHEDAGEVTSKDPQTLSISLIR